MMKLLILNLCLSICLVSCAKKSSDTSPRSVENQTGETAGGSSGGTAGGSDGGADGGSDGGSDGGTEGGYEGGSDGGTDGGTDGGYDGGSDGGSTGGYEPNVGLFVGSAQDAHNGFETTGFADVIDHSSATNVNFNRFKKGKYSKLGSLDADKFEFTVGAEKLKNTEPVTDLEQAFGSKTYKFKVENPVSQNGKKGIESGIETKTGLFAIKKITGIWRFARPVSYWGANLIDVESTAKVPAKLRLFDCQSQLIQEFPIEYPDNENGNKQIHFVGFVSDTANVCAVSVSVGDFSILGGLAQGLFRAIAIDDFIFGE